MHLILAYDRAQYDRVVKTLDGECRFISDAVELAHAITQARVGRPKRRDHSRPAFQDVDVVLVTGWTDPQVRTARHVGGVFSTLAATDTQWRYLRDDAMLDAAGG